MAQQLPLVPAIANYDFATVLGGTTYVFNVYWNARDAAWYLDLLAEDETPIRHGVKILLGSPLGRRSASPLFPAGVLLASDLSGENLDATFDDLGTRVVVYFFTADELAALVAA
jgi:hypothetical protein